MDRQNNQFHIDIEVYGQQHDMWYVGRMNRDKDHGNVHFDMPY